MSKLFTGLVLLLGLVSTIATAQPFNEQTYQQLQADQQVVLIDVKAKWCPTCAKQAKILKRYFEQHPDSSITLLEVDFDDQKQWVSHFKAPRQSTLVLMKGEQRLWFSVAETREDKIFAALKAAESK
ncbi:thioredoxin family protein [Neiella sp. HB171785]|uniref:Thioredoxin family protein n=1 Tax=Neiella litorisoli TaxID=2771431 RepID=A0A8J6QI84_9GAMM|nr:thioredoxin family protein [Neiella litorisoli]MBD1390395.1 thioredoxin family protein [Neiella litorisoli]